MTPHASKFATPPPPASYVPRPRLETRLQATENARLTVVSGRAGSGKTALLSSWITTIAERDRAWITLDADDNESSVFWTNIDTALAGAQPERHARHSTTGARGATRFSSSTTRTC